MIGCYKIKGLESYIQLLSKPFLSIECHILYLFHFDYLDELLTIALYRYQA